MIGEADSVILAARLYEEESDSDDFVVYIVNEHNERQVQMSSLLESLKLPVKPEIQESLIHKIIKKS